MSRAAMSPTGFVQNGSNHTTRTLVLRKRLYGAAEMSVVAKIGKLHQQETLARMGEAHACLAKQGSTQSAARADRFNELRRRALSIAPASRGAIVGRIRNEFPELTWEQLQAVGIIPKTWKEPQAVSEPEKNPAIVIDEPPVSHRHSFHGRRPNGPSRKEREKQARRSANFQSVRNTLQVIGEIADELPKEPKRTAPRSARERKAMKAAKRNGGKNNHGANKKRR